MERIVGISGLGPSPQELKLLHVSGHALASAKYSVDLAELQQVLENNGKLLDFGEVNRRCAGKLPDDIVERTPTEAELDLFVDCMRVGAGLDRKYTKDPTLKYGLIAGGVLLVGVGAWYFMRKK